jgi:hypothetical protein
VRALVVCLFAILLSGCSTIRLAYPNADTYLSWQANRFFSLSSEQRSELDRHLARVLAWHRGQALGRYALLAEDAATRLARGLAHEDIAWASNTIAAQIREALVAAARETAPLVDRLGPEQLAHLETRLAQENRKYVEEFVEPSLAERRERRLKRTVEQLEDWVGTLSEAQLERVRRYSRESTVAPELRDAHRRRMQAEFIAIARAREAHSRLAGWAARVFPDKEQGLEPGLAAAVRSNQAEYLQMLIDIDRALTPAQRRRAVARLKGYADEFRSLAQVPVAAREARGAPQ